MSEASSCKKGVRLSRKFEAYEIGRMIYDTTEAYVMERINASGHRPQAFILLD
jgi:hypothetical protein